jgi:hypothetical protein
MPKTFNPGEILTASDVNDFLVSKLLQVKSTLKTNAFSGVIAANSNLAVPNLEVKITPRDSASNILVLVTLNAAIDNDRFNFAIRRNGGASVFRGDPAGNRTRNTGAANNVPVVSSTVNFVGLDAADTTSEITYDVVLFNGSGTSATALVNRGTTDTDNASFGRYVSSITVMEVTA